MDEGIVSILLINKKMYKLMVPALDESPGKLYVLLEFSGCAKHYLRGSALLKFWTDL
jgi:hypothetical protein